MLGQDWRGFKHDHQCRVSNAALREAARLASERPNRTRSSRSSPRRARSRRRCLASVPCGTTTPRNVIAAHRGIIPEEFVSVHRGTLVGARKLDLTVVKGRIRYADLAVPAPRSQRGRRRGFLCLSKGRLDAAMLAE